MKKVVFIVNGLGLGNSTRCYAVIERLAEKGVEVHVITSGNGLWFFSDKPVASLLAIEELKYGSRKGQISIFETFLKIGWHISSIRKNNLLIGGYLDTIQPVLAITDSNYNFMPVRKRNIPIIALNNADRVIDGYKRFKDRPANIRGQFYGIEYPDYLFHKIVADSIISPALDTEGDRPQDENRKLHHVGPIVQKKCLVRTNKNAADALRVVVMLSGSAFGTKVGFNKSSYPCQIDVIGRETPKNFKTDNGVTFHGKIKNTEDFLRDADLVVVNGGFSAVSEAFFMRKPAVIVPVPGHAEQWFNARSIQQLGVGTMCCEKDIEETILSMITRLHKYRTAYDRLGTIKDGAQQTCDMILDHLDRRV